MSTGPRARTASTCYRRQPSGFDSRGEREGRNRQTPIVGREGVANGGVYWAIVTGPNGEMSNCQDLWIKVFWWAAMGGSCLVTRSRFRPFALNIDQPRASKLVAAAVAAGLVRRQADQADGRRALLVRTPAVRRLSAQAHAFRRQVFGEAMAGWPAADRAEFARLLTRFVESLAGVTR